MADAVKRAAIARRNSADRAKPLPNSNGNVPDELAILVKRYDWILDNNKQHRITQSAAPRKVGARRDRRMSAPPSRPGGDQAARRTGPDARPREPAAMPMTARPPVSRTRTHTEPARAAPSAQPSGPGMGLNSNDPFGPDAHPPEEEYKQITLVPCSICGKKFAEERIEKHEGICAKAAAKKRKVFDMTQKRAVADEDGSIPAPTTRPPVRKAPKKAMTRRPPPKAAGGPGVKGPAKKGDWRAQSEALRARISGKEVVEVDTRVVCDICGRKFAEDRVDKHFSVCAASWAKKNNKPIPKRKRAR